MEKRVATKEERLLFEKLIQNDRLYPKARKIPNSSENNQTNNYQNSYYPRNPNSIQNSAQHLPQQNSVPNGAARIPSQPQKPKIVQRLNNIKRNIGKRDFIWEQKRQKKLQIANQAMNNYNNQPQYSKPKTYNQMAYTENNKEKTPSSYNQNYQRTPSCNNDYNQNLSGSQRLPQFCYKGNNRNIPENLMNTGNMRPYSKGSTPYQENMSLTSPSNNYGNYNRLNNQNYQRSNPYQNNFRRDNYGIGNNTQNQMRNTNNQIQSNVPFKYQNTRTPFVDYKMGNNFGNNNQNTIKFQNRTPGRPFENMSFKNQYQNTNQVNNYYNFGRNQTVF